MYTQIMLTFQATDISGKSNKLKSIPQIKRILVTAIWSGLGY